MFRYIKKFIIFNKSQKNKFVDIYHLKKKIVFESALSAYTYLRLFEIKPKPNYRYALFMGLIKSYKGLEYLFPAMELLHKKHPDFHLIVAGAGEYYFDISKYRNYNYIHIINRFCNDEEIASLIAHSDYVVCPYNDATQSGVVMAAYAFDKPCIVTHTGGLPEMVGEGEFGIVVPPKNTLKLTEAMCLLTENKDLLTEYSKRIKLEYSSGNKAWQQYAKDIYENVYII